MEKKCKKCGIFLTEETAAKKNKTQWRRECRSCRSKDVCAYIKRNQAKINKRVFLYRRRTGKIKEYPCEMCGKKQIRKGQPHTCSNRCRFLFYVRQKGECWEWTGGKNRSGYGKFYRDGKHIAAHRASFELFKAELPSGKFICHSCDNPWCVNPLHLWPGTPKENMKDMVIKKRHAYGERSKKAKLTEKEVKEIFELSKMGITQKELSKRFLVGTTTIFQILHKKTWKHVHTKENAS
jgi:hypothetical protein